MKKKWIVAFAVLVLMVGFAVCQEEVPSYLVIEDIDYDDDDYNIHGKVVMGVKDPAEVPTHVNIPNGIVAIGAAFSGCTSLMSVTIPKSVTEVGSGAFEGCKGIEVIYEGALKDWCATDWDYSICENAKIITLSDGKDLKKLTKIDAGDLAGVTKIGDYAFSKCTSLVSVTIHGSVTKIGAFAFGGCTSLASEILQTDQLVRQIKTAMQEQNDGSRQITGTLREMNASTDEVRSFAEEMAEGSKSILEEMRKLQDATGSMKSRMDERAVGARKINDTGSALGAISGEMKRTIAKIGEQIDRFKKE